jgi:hypothetical protein
MKVAVQNVRNFVAHQCIDSFLKRLLVLFLLG